MSDVLMRQWVIYENPADYPGCFVVREWHIIRGEMEPVPMKACSLAPTLRAAREIVPPGLHCIARAESDDPTIVEVWL